MNVSGTIKQDYEAHALRKYSVTGLITGLVTQPGLRAVAMVRGAHWLWSRRLRGLAMLLASANHAITGADVSPEARFGPGLAMRHPSGVVVGRGVIVGANCTLLQHTTLGEKDLGRRGPGRYPRLGDRVTVGAGALVLGSCTVGSGATIGANSVVVTDVAAETTVVGAPAHPI